MRGIRAMMLAGIHRRLADSVSERASRSTVQDVRIGVYWTGVVTTGADGQHTGIAATFGGPAHQHERIQRSIGNLIGSPAGDLLGLMASSDGLDAAVGMATLNSLLDVDESRCMQVNAKNVILERGAGKRIAMVGHFPFVGEAREAAAHLDVLELRPQPGDLYADKAPEVVPLADVVAITGSSLLNHTFEGIMDLCDADATVVVLGGSTPLSPLLFDVGVDIIAGTRIVDEQAALLAISQGAGYRQIPGKRLLTMERGVSAATAPPRRASARAVQP